MYPPPILGVDSTFIPPRSLQQHAPQSHVPVGSAASDSDTYRHFRSSGLVASVVLSLHPDATAAAVELRPFGVNAARGVRWAALCVSSRSDEADASANAGRYPNPSDRFRDARGVAGVAGAAAGSRGAGTRFGVAAGIGAGAGPRAGVGSDGGVGNDGDSNESVADDVSGASQTPPASASDSGSPVVLPASLVILDGSWLIWLVKWVETYRSIPPVPRPSKTRTPLRDQHARVLRAEAFAFDRHPRMTGFEDDAVLRTWMRPKETPMPSLQKHLKALKLGIRAASVQVCVGRLKRRAGVCLLSLVRVGS